MLQVKTGVLDITTTPRDLAVSLINYVKPNFKSTSFILKRAALSDTDVHDINQRLKRMEKC